MKKAAIITLNGYNNYGNRLQNYALQEVINRLGYTTDTIINGTHVIKNHEKTKLGYKIKEFIKKPVSKKIYLVNHMLYLLVNKREITEMNSIRVSIFKDFTNKYISETSYSIDDNNLPENQINSYDFFVTGSDQVWNPFDAAAGNVTFLDFAPIEKRIAYAPSFGVSTIPEVYIDHYKTWLSKMNKISVREEQGARIIRDLTGREVQVVLDPTMLLTKDDWLAIAQKAPNKPKEDYILTYFLGEVSKDLKRMIDEISKEKHLKIVNLANLRDKEHYATGPSEFIDYINSAKLFMTDSFHGCVFSLLLETPLVICERNGQKQVESMNSRIDTFVNKFNLEDRKLDKIVKEKIFDNNYKEAKLLLEVERKKSLEYLSEAVGSILK
ncbi:polysaccharide pyruvyl transferase family protein [Niameybacter massiliensis]|uniref:Polysaccharide pyruvyl transferase family protein n=1 Tax=Holtiella tumoricola TaxID=3018743 RepID=A0AA42DQT0_9FIRM|nr:polysaccharide pyruvyl transferase family protein [Holtiella tumoricola]MDA3733168.1 polysaccharide pyruvyl transferase family protein [Holtiella tumoricola]